MKILVFTIVLFTILFVTTIAQQGWFCQNPLPQGNRWIKLILLFQQPAGPWEIAVQIIKTTNGGESWVSQLSGTTNNLFEVSFTDADIGTAVGYEGTILRTTDGGENWISQ